MGTTEFQFPDPKPTNPDRVHIVRANPDCPRCDFNCENCEFDGPDSRMHCPGCKQGLVTAGRNHWTDNPKENCISEWWFDAQDWRVEVKAPPDPDCCAGCEFLAKAVSP